MRRLRVRRIAIALTQENPIFLAALEHFRIVGEFGDRGGAIKRIFGGRTSERCP